MNRKIKNNGTIICLFKALVISGWLLFPFVVVLWAAFILQALSDSAGCEVYFLCMIPLLFPSGLLFHYFPLNFAVAKSCWMLICQAANSFFFPFTNFYHIFVLPSFTTRSKWNNFRYVFTAGNLFQEQGCFIYFLWPLLYASSRIKSNNLDRP